MYLKKKLHFSYTSFNIYKYIKQDQQYIYNIYYIICLHSHFCNIYTILLQKFYYFEKKKKQNLKYFTWSHKKIILIIYIYIYNKIIYIKLLFIINYNFFINIIKYSQIYYTNWIILRYYNTRCFSILLIYFVIYFFIFLFSYFFILFFYFFIFLCLVLLFFIFLVISLFLFKYSASHKIIINMLDIIQFVRCFKYIIISI